MASSFISLSIPATLGSIGHVDLALGNPTLNPFQGCMDGDSNLVIDQVRFLTDSVVYFTTFEYNTTASNHTGITYRYR